MNHEHVERLRTLASRIRANQRYPSHRTRARYRLEEHEKPCDCGAVHADECELVKGGPG